MISTKLTTIYESVEDMYDALTERQITVSPHTMNQIPRCVATIKGISYPTPIPTSSLLTWEDKADAMRQIKAQIKQVIENSGVRMTNDITTFGDGIRAIVVSNVFELSAPATYTGKWFYVTAYFNGRAVVASNWTVTTGSLYAEVNEYGKVTISRNISNKNITISAQYTYNNVVYTDDVTVNVTWDNELSIESADVMTGTTGNCVAVYNGEVVSGTWSITSGNEYATINSSTGEITILSCGFTTVQCVYSGSTATKTINMVYQANTTTETTVDEDGNTTTTTTTTTTDPDTGSTTTSTSTTTTNEDGSTTSTTVNTTENTDGSSTTQTTQTNTDGTSSETSSTVSAPDPDTGSVTTNTNTTNYDNQGNTTGSSTNTTTENTDGSSTSSTTNYDAEGDPTTGTNQIIDSSGNNSTQDIEYDDQGDPSVTGYSIDTSGNPEGSMDITGDGVNTEFVPFDGSNKGWICHIRFRSVRTEQPNPPLVEDTEDHGSNYLYNILNAKSPYKPYPGFYLRWALNKKTMSGNLVFGYTSNHSSSTTQRQIPSNNNVFDLNLIYDPDLLVYPSKFRVESLNTTMATISVNVEFNANEMDFTLGYAISQAGTPYRYSNCEIYEFTISKLAGY